MQNSKTRVQSFLNQMQNNIYDTSQKDHYELMTYCFYFRSVDKKKIHRSNIIEFFMLGYEPREK